MGLLKNIRMAREAVRITSEGRYGVGGFEGNLTSSKWAKMCKVSQDTASREISSLVSKGILRQEGRGRSTHYVLV